MPGTEPSGDDRGVVYSWGCGAFGQLGHGDRIDRLMPCRVIDCPSAFTVLAAGGHSASAIVDGTLHNLRARIAEEEGGRCMTSVAAGVMAMVVVSFYCCCHRRHAEEGHLYTCGSGQNGLLGQGTLEDSVLFKPVVGIVSERVVSVSVGDAHMAAATGTFHRVRAPLV